MMNFDPVSRAAMQATKPNNAGRADTLLDVENLRVRFQMTGGGLTAVDGISFQVRRGEFLAVVGESGCGKSVSALSIMRLLPTKTARISAGRLSFAGRDLLSLPEDDMRAIRGREIGMIFQEPMTSLNPVMTIGSQLTEHLKIHLAMPEQAATERALELLNLVGIPDPKTRLGQYPHQFSGGMRQRVMIAIAIACNPRLIIADEPTTALDVTVQAQILDLIQKLTRELGIATIIITHNLGVVARYADNVNVMYAGRIIERAPADRLFARPRHPYTMGLLRAVPRLDEPRRGRLATIEGLPPNLANPPTGCRFAPRCPARDDICERDPSLYPAGADHTAACLRLDDLADTGPEQLYGTSVGEATTATLSDEPILQVRDLKTFFPITLRTGWLSSRKVTVRAVDGIDLDIRAGETLGLVGESGCGKTTVGRSILFLEEPTEGSIAFRGKELVQADGRERRAEKRSMQVIFQDPFSSLNPRMTIGAILAEPVGVYNLRQGKRAIRERVLDLLKQVGLFPEMAERYPHELSGGQRQRVGIARALALEPKLIICDEPVSALDVSVQAQIVNLLEELQATQGLTFLFIAHDLAVVRHISNRIAVMYLGKIVEIADRDQLYSNPLHPYTKALLAAAPIPDPVAERSRSLEALRGELPSPLNHPKGCVFSSRCPIASEECRRHVPSLHDFGAGHRAACIKI